MFVYQPVFNMLDLKAENSGDYITGWKSKGVCNSEHRAFLPNIKYFIKNTLFVVEQFHNKNCNCLHRL